MRRRAYLGTVGTALAVAASGCLGSAAPASDAADYDVGMSVNAYRPETVETTVGSTVVWKNTSGRRHTVTAYEDVLPDGADFFSTGDFDSESAAVAGWDARFGGGLSPDRTFEYTFDVPGTYGYYCIPHERQGMVGTVEVRE